MSEKLSKLLADVKQWPDHKLVGGTHDPNFCVRCIREWKVIPDLERQLDEAREVIKPLADLIKNIPETYGDNYLTELISCRAIRRAAQWEKDNQERGEG